MARKKAAAVYKQTLTFVGNQQQQSTKKVLFPETKPSFGKPAGSIFFLCQYRTSDLEICNYLGKPPHYYDDDCLVFHV